MLQRAFKASYNQFLVSAVRNDNMESITLWVENNLLNQNPDITDVKKIAFYEAEKSLVTEYVMGNNFSGLKNLIDAIDNEKFDKEFKDHLNYPRLKANECRVLADAIIASKRHLDQNDTMHKQLGELLHTKYQTLKDIKYDVSKITTIDDAFQIIHYEESPVMGSISDTTDCL